MVTGFGANRCTWLHINFGRVSHGAQTLCVAIALLLHYLVDSMVFGLFCGGFVKVHKSHGRPEYPSDILDMCIDPVPR
jgi:hypothetical protein